MGKKTLRQKMRNRSTQRSTLNGVTHEKYNKDDIMDATGPSQLCAGQLAGCEAGVHTLRSLFNNSSTERVLLVDATNAFNQLNRQAALRNIQAICPSLAHILVNCYRDPVALHTSTGDIIWSKEGTTQGDPLGVTPLIKKLSQKCSNTINLASWSPPRCLVG